jgi:hypothetical protein
MSIIVIIIELSFLTIITIAVTKYNLKHSKSIQIIQGKLDNTSSLGDNDEVDISKAMQYLKPVNTLENRSLNNDVER